MIIVLIYLALRWLANSYAVAFDYDEVLMICMGFAAFAYVVLDFKREKRTELYVLELVERVARLEANSDDSVTLESRLVQLEAAAARDERLEERISNMAERVAVLETKLDEWEEVEVDEDEDDDG